jgi:FMN-dependent oxidoreductase (nitrilotriacetate monooxygenase family)
MHIGGLLHPGGIHMYGWRHERGMPEYAVSVKPWQELARLAEQAKFDLIFVADMLAMPWPIGVSSRSVFYTQGFEPFTLFSNLAAVTEYIGLVVTASTTYWHPYHVARITASLDQLSNGRAGWNIVTSATNEEAAHFGLAEQVSHAERYKRATEFVELVRSLWDTVEPGVFLGDKASGRVFDEGKMKEMTFDGDYFSVAGTLTVPPSAQGRPVLVQAGQSEAGRRLAASVAEVVFAAVPSLEVALEFSTDIRAKMVESGRSADDARILPGLVPIIGRSEAEAQEKLAELDQLLDPEVGIGLIKAYLGLDLAGQSLDAPFPELSKDTNFIQTLADTLPKWAKPGETLTIRDVASRLSSGLGIVVVSGTPSDIADMMEDWFRRSACDGFLVAPLTSPTSLVEFVEHVVPELQRRGLFRTEYEGKTFRSNLGFAARTVSTTSRT